MQNDQHNANISAKIKSHIKWLIHETTDLGYWHPASMLFRRFGGQQQGWNAILFNKNLIQAMRILGPLLTFTQQDHQKYTDTIKTKTFLLFTKILLSEALETNMLKGWSGTDHQSFDYIINQLAKVTRYWKINLLMSFPSLKICATCKKGMRWQRQGQWYLKLKCKINSISWCCLQAQGSPLTWGPATAKFINLTTKTFQLQA